MANHVFKGQVKVADVQAAFDEYVNRINNLINMYNTTNTLIEGLDLSKGSNTLASGGYSLSVGGVKQLLAAYNGTLLGTRAFRIDSNHVGITDGLYIYNEKPYRIKSQVLTGNGYDVYFNPSDGSVGLVNNNIYPSEDCVLILQLSTSEDAKYLNEFRDVQLEGVPNYLLTVQKRAIGTSIESDNPSIHRFQGATNNLVTATQGGGKVDFIDDENRFTYCHGIQDPNPHRGHRFCGQANFLFIPKGVNTPLHSVIAGYVTGLTQYICDLIKN